ncbi:BnaA07g08130D [Brassica napus]|uniref:BnaA07g08130D protein n=1 Tax=Brassica napus TaxID=3708 RepID=A0A078FS16_BRANA|nr:BnaA07g08130D [Brassica napus]
MDSPVNFILSLLTVVKTLTTFFEKNGELLAPSF